MVSICIGGDKLVHPLVGKFVFVAGSGDAATSTVCDIGDRRRDSGGNHCR